MFQDLQKYVQNPTLKEFTSEIEKEICFYPPSNQAELCASLLEYLSSRYFTYPLSFSLLIFDYFHLNANFKKYYSIVSRLEIHETLKFLEQKGALETEIKAVGAKLEPIIVKIDLNMIIQLKREYFNDRPKQFPKDNNLMNNDKIIYFKTTQDQSMSNKQKLQKILAEPTAIKLEFQRTIEERQRKQILASVANQIKEYNFFSLKSEICKFQTRFSCFEKSHKKYCEYTHLYKILSPFTKYNEVCNKEKYLTVCQQNRCQYYHYDIETEEYLSFLRNIYISLTVKLSLIREPKEIQWINCDLRDFDFSILGKFDAIMLDPPWDIHMNLPYGTLQDKEMKSLKVKMLQDKGVCFLWVTGRVLELGRDCLTEWGYKRIEEIVWIKTNQQGKIARTGRTGHWLNHSKEHCLVGIKGEDFNVNRNVDCDVIVAEVRETSRKPDEIYSLIERMCPGGRKCELFARPHNRRPGWISLGNQLPGIYVETSILDKFNQRYPDANLTTEKMESFKYIEQKEKQEFIKNVYSNHLVRNTRI